MADHSAADDRVRAVEWDLDVRDLDVCDTVGTGGDIPEITGVAVAVGGGAVGLFGRVEVRACRQAAVGGIAKLRARAVRANRHARVGSANQDNPRTSQRVNLAMEKQRFGTAGKCAPGEYGSRAGRG